MQDHRPTFDTGYFLTHIFRGNDEDMLSDVPRMDFAVFHRWLADKGLTPKLSND